MTAEDKAGRLLNAESQRVSAPPGNAHQLEVVAWREDVVCDPERDRKIYDRIWNALSAHGWSDQDSEFEFVDAPQS